MVRNAVLSAFAVASLATTVHSSPIQTDLGFPEDTNSNFPAAIGGSKGHFPIGSALGQAATSMSSDSRFNSRIYADFSGVSSGQDVESMLAYVQALCLLF